MVKQSLFVVAMLSGCAADPALPETSPAPIPIEGQVMTPPIAVVNLDNGNQLQFFGGAGEGTAVLELGNVANGPSVTDLPELRDATPAEIFWAVSKINTAVPPELAIASVAAARPQGWLVDELGPSLAIATECTSDVVFDEEFCDVVAPYDSHKCFFNRTGNTTWISDRSSRYKVGLCVQEGTVHDQLRYTDHNPLGACGFGFPGGTSWTFDVGAGGSIKWTWIAGSEDWWRTFTHETTQATGDVFDHGQRWNYEPNCK